VCASLILLLLYQTPRETQRRWKQVRATAPVPEEAFGVDHKKTPEVLARPKHLTGETRRIETPLGKSGFKVSVMHVRTCFVTPLSHAES